MRNLLAVAALACLGACTYPAGPGSTNLVDGSYQGRASLLVVKGPACPDGQYGVVEIADRILDFGYVPGVALEAPVLPDGSLHAENGATILDGKLTGEHLAVTITTPQCQSTFAGDFIWNHS